MKNEAVLDEDVAVEELTEKEIKTVEQFHRQLSSHSILSIKTEDGLEIDEPDRSDGGEVLPKETFTQEETLLIKKVLRAFGYKLTVANDTEILEQDMKDTVDGRRIYRGLFSSELSKTLRGNTSRFVSPGRLYVRVSEHTKAMVREVNDKIALRKPNSSKGYHVTVKTQENLESTNEKLKDQLTGRHSMSNATNGHDLPRPSPMERFREIGRTVIVRSFMEKRGKARWFNLMFTIFGAAAFLADSGTDLKVASDHFTTGHHWWGTFTLILVIIPTVLVNLLSYFFYKKDRDHGTLAPESGWKAVKITHICQVGLVERYWRILVKGYKIKRKKLHDSLTSHYPLYIAMNLDAAMLQMILAFTEDAPQLVLQLYVLIRRHRVETLQISKLQDLWTITSLCFSFISYSRATVNYISCLRNSKKSKGVLRWYGYIAMLLWRSFMFISRILVLVFFASEFHLWFFLVLSLHFVIILALMTLTQEVNFSPEQKVMQKLIRVVIAYIHTFCFFPLEASKTIKWAMIYYSLNAVEAVIFSSLWFTNVHREISLKLELAGLSAIFVSYALGLLMMVVYYKFLHPKFKEFEIEEDVSQEGHEQATDLDYASVLARKFAVIDLM